MADPSIVDLIEKVAKKVWKVPEIPREFIIEALDRIEDGQERVETYPSGQPTMRAVYAVAVQLQSASAMKH